MLLADLGADVIKIESPEGDGTRQWRPPTTPTGQSSYFAGVNRGKRSVVCDLKTEAGLASAKNLALSADILIENFKPGTMQRFGLAYEQLQQENPGLIYCSISGFGDTGGKDLPGYDLLVQAVGGLMSITGETTGEPTKVGVALVDILTGLNAALGIQTALLARTKDGLGQQVKVTLLGSLLSALSNQAQATIDTGTPPRRMGNAHPSIAPYETFTAKDQQLALAVGTDGQFQKLCAVIGRADVAQDPRFQTNPARVANRQTLKQLIEEALKTRCANDWIAKCRTHGIPAGRVNTIDQAFELAESLGIPVYAQTGGDTPQTIANPLWLSRTPPLYKNPPPEIGEHNGQNWQNQ